MAISAKVAHSFAISSEDSKRLNIHFKILLILSFHSEGMFAFSSILDTPYIPSSNVYTFSVASDIEVALRIKTTRIRLWMSLDV